MDLKNYTTGVQHVGVPTNDIAATIAFYHKLGFETAFETVNKEANEKVAFLKHGTLVIETYENKAAKMEAGASDHVALNVNDIEEICKLHTCKSSQLLFYDDNLKLVEELEKLNLNVILV